MSPEGMDPFSNLLFDSGLSQNIISQVSRHDRDSNRESVAADRAVPHLMAALAMAHKGATMSQQDAAQLRVKAAAHALHGDARSSILYMAKLNAAVGVKGNAIAERNLGRDFPKTGSDGFVAWSLGHHVKRIARRNPHTAFSVKDDVYHKGFAAEVGVDNIIHAYSLHPLTRSRQRQLRPPLVIARSKATRESMKSWSRGVNFKHE